MEVHRMQTQTTRANKTIKKTGQAVQRSCKIKFHSSRKTPRKARDVEEEKRVSCGLKRAQSSRCPKQEGQIKAVSRATSTHSSRISQSSTETTASKCSSTRTRWRRKQAAKPPATTAATWALGLAIRPRGR